MLQIYLKSWEKWNPRQILTRSVCFFYFRKIITIVPSWVIPLCVHKISHILQPKSSDTLSEVQYSQGPSTLCEFFAHVHSSLHYTLWRTVEWFLLALLMGTSEFAVELYAFPHFLLFLLLFAYLSSSAATYLCFLWPPFSYTTTINSMSTVDLSLEIPEFLITVQNHCLVTNYNFHLS